MLAVARLAILTVFGMGGWAVVSVKDLPEYFVAGQQYTIEFQVRQHGRTLLSGLQPTLVLNETAIPAVARGNGTYAVTFTAPAAGRLFMTIKSGFHSSELRLYPQTVVARGAARPVATIDRGAMLFVAKGCNVCHANSDLSDRPDNQELTVGPPLGGRKLARQAVFQKIQHPASEVMPDLGLTDAEAMAIATFLSGERTAATGGGR